MRLLDERFRENKKKYILQILFGASLIFFVMLLWNIITSHAMIASLGATIFILISAPHGSGSGTKYLLGGYLCGAIGGIIGFYLAELFVVDAVAGGVAVAVTMLLMILFDFEHPPAAAFSLGLAILEEPLIPTLATIFCVAIFCLLMRFTRKHMIDLL